MDEARVIIIKKRPKVVLNKSFSVFSELDVGDKGLMSLTGVIEGKELEPQSDGNELFVCSINITKAERIEILGVQRE